MHLERFDLNLLVAIDALLRHRNVTAAASELLITQSALSSALKRARQHFEDDILYYDGQKMVPTPFGKELAERVPELIARLRALTRMRAQNDLSKIKRMFTIVASDYVAAVYVSALCKVLGQRAPGVTISVVPFTDDSIRQFKRGVVDFFIAPDFVAEEGFDKKLLFEETFKCVLCRDNPLAETEFDEQAFFSSPQVITNFFVGDGKSHFERWLTVQDKDPNYAATLPSFVALPYYIPGTRNIATIHRRLVPHFEKNPNLVFRDPPIKIPPLQEFLINSHRQNHDPETKMLRELMLDVGRTL